MTANRIIRIGPAGWSYKDWEGVVYPQKPGAKFDPLEYLARSFNTIEINSSFYRPFTPATAKSWAHRVAGVADFMFTAKIHVFSRINAEKLQPKILERLSVRNIP